MNLASLAAKQKRLQTWKNLLTTQVQEDELRTEFATGLSRYASLIARCWKAGKITDKDVLEIDDLERRLEQLEENGRLIVVGKEKLSKPLRRI
jgi:hypothetical protein